MVNIIRYPAIYEYYKNDINSEKKITEYNK